MTAKFSVMLLASVVAAECHAAFYNNSYTFNFNDPSAYYTVSRFYILEARNAPDYSYNYGFRQPYVTIASPYGGVVTDYAGILTAPATDALIIAETDAMPGDAPGQKHILLGMNSDAATYAAGIAWGTLFTNTLEDDIIWGLDNYVDPDPSVTGQALQNLVNYAYGDAKYGILDGLAQPHTAWFAPGSDFTLMAWSDGKVVGTGTSQQTPAVPEPTTIVALGLGALALLRRRR